MGESDSKPKKLQLFVEIGNSNIKAAARNSGSWNVLHSGKIGEAAAFADWLQKMAPNVENIVVSSVRADILSYLKENTHLPLHVLDISRAKLEKLDYKSISTLGIDRYLVCLGAHGYFEKAVVVIDSGSACTVDYMDAEGRYMGGVIMPGLNLVQQIFNTKAPELPQVEVGIPASWPGKDTVTSLQWGLTGLFTDGLRAALQRYKEAFGDYELFITGGDASAVESLLAGAGRVEPYLIFDGMLRMVSRKEG